MPSLSGWFKPSSSVVRLYVRSLPHRFPCHFVDFAGRDPGSSVPRLRASARCIGPGCVLCELSPPVTRAIVVVQDPASRENRLLEVRERLPQVVAEMLELGPELVGRPIWAWMDVGEHGRPLEVTLERPDHVARTQHSQRLEIKAVPCENYIARIGTREYAAAVAWLSSYRDQLELPQPAALMIA